MKKLLNGILDFTEFVPLGWVLTCCDLGTDWMTKCPLDGILTLAVSTVIAGILWGLGTFAATGGSWNKSEACAGTGIPIGARLKYLLILIAALAVITGLIEHAPLPDDIVL